MGFLNFLKRKEKDSFKFPSKEELDIPPAPSLRGTHHDEVPQFPMEAEEPEPMQHFEREAVKIEEAELEERDNLSLGKPIFIRSDLFKAMMDEVGVIKTTLKENEQIIGRVGDFKGDEDKEFDKWHNQILDIQRKLIYAEKTLFG